MTQCTCFRPMSVVALVSVLCGQIGAELMAETERALRSLLLEMGVADVDAKTCCSLKLLRTPPGASRQKLHYDISQMLPLKINRYVYAMHEACPSAVADAGDADSAVVVGVSACL